MDVRFVVEHAGCPSCGELVRAALEPFGVVRELTVDEADDSSSVRMRFAAGPSQEAVDATLADASVGSGHEYRVRPGSWHADD
jgi:hypothetical protein